MILGEALGAVGLTLYEAEEAGTAYRPLTTWPEEGTGLWGVAGGAAAAELSAALAERAFVDAPEGLASGLFPAGMGIRRLLVPLRASGRLVGFIAAAFPFERTGQAESALASYTLSLAAAWAKSRAEKALARAVAEEAAARRAGTLLLARAGHELRTPLVALDGIAALLEERGEAMDPQRRAEAVRHIRQGGKRLMRLVEEILALTRMDAGLRSLEARPLDFAQIARASEALMAGLLARKEVAFAAVIAGGLPEGFASDLEAVTEILENLLGNAAKYSSRGSIGLRIEPGAGDSVSFTVSDEGAGMDAESLASFSKPFHATRAGLSGERGSGLGLAIVANLSRLLGGRFVIDSEKGRGTTARLVIPPLGEALRDAGE